MCLRFVFLLITRTVSWLRLSQRKETWKTAEILLLRHQLAVLQRRQPRRSDLDWADRALLATLLAVIPKVRHYGLRLLVSPDTIVRWHRDIVRRRWAARSIRGKTGRPATRRNIKALVLRMPQHRRHDRRDQRRILHRRQLGQPHPVREPATHSPAHLTGQPGLAVARLPLSGLRIL